MRSEETNLRLIRRIMKESNYGAIAEAFVIEAVVQYAGNVAAMTDEHLVEMDKAGPLLSAAAWRGVALEIKSIMDQRFREH